MRRSVASDAKRAGAFVLLAAGVVLVFAGVAGALAFSASGMIASAAAIVALLYGGGVWFGRAPRDDAAVVLFTPQLTVAVGPLTGRAMLDLFPIPLRKEIGEQCHAALAGESRRFSPAGAGTFQAAPIRSADGLIVYGILIQGAATPERATAAG